MRHVPLPTGTARTAAAITLTVGLLFAGAGIGGADPTPRPPASPRTTAGTTAPRSTTPRSTAPRTTTPRSTTPRTGTRSTTTATTGMPCTDRQSPPPPVDRSEVPRPGEPTPTPLPVPTAAVGGERLTSCGLVLPAGAPPLPAEVAAAAWVVADARTGAVIAARDPHGRHRPASTIKVLLTLVVLDHLDLDTPYTVTEADTDTEGSSMYLAAGDRTTVRELVQGMLLISGNDAALALAHLLGGPAEAVRLMNAKAESLGTTSTRAATPSGLDGPGMSTSAYDIALIMRAALRDPRFVELSVTPTLERPLPAGMPTPTATPATPRAPAPTGPPMLTITNANRLLTDFPGGGPGKVGFTDDARKTFVGSARRGDRELVISLLYSNGPLLSSGEGMALLGWAFSFDGTEPVGALPDLPVAAEQTDGTEPLAVDADVSSAGVVPAAALGFTALTVLGIGYLVHERRNRTRET